MKTEYCLCNIELEIYDPKPIEFHVEDIPEIWLEIGESGRYATEYDGTYDVSPMINIEQVLLTKDRTLREDVTIREIMIASVSNSVGGKTVTIGVY